MLFYPQFGGNLAFNYLFGGGTASLKTHQICVGEEAKRPLGSLLLITGALNLWHRLITLITLSDVITDASTQRFCSSADLNV